MPTPPDLTHDLEFGGPATYRIVVQGVIDERWQRRVGGMSIEVGRGDPGRVRTTLRGDIEDQAALQGILDTLHALHLPILELKVIDPAAAAAGPAED